MCQILSNKWGALHFIHWVKQQKGIGVYLLVDKLEQKQLEDFQFISTPSSVPDGKGIVGLTNDGNRQTLVYAPIEMPLADVTNAWMFADTKEERSRFINDAGLFRPNQFDQLYKLYETEIYHCSSYDHNYPTRPYLVTTDIFWEIFGAAFQGLFITREQDIAIPAFKKMIHMGNSYFESHDSDSKWKAVFKILNGTVDYKNDSKEITNEVELINNEIDGFSDLLGEEFSYSTLKPRGHYTANKDVEQYFKAFKYFISVFKSYPEIMEELNTLPIAVQEEAKKWIGAYRGFIAPSRKELVWNNINNSVPVYLQNKPDDKCLFPLSWGIDNEVLDACVYHSSYPEALQIRNEREMRLLPSGLDLAAALGSSFSEELLKKDIEAFPNLGRVIGNLKELYTENKSHSDFTGNIYNRWLSAVSTQWLDDVQAINSDSVQKVWKTKRLQTGLATWATLRHATVLVNGYGAAECGEGGFEELVTRAPRGYVEPDPKTLYAIAGLFDMAIDYTESAIKDFSDKQNHRVELYNGIIERLKDAAEETRLFAKMAEKEIAGEMLSEEENDKILHVARVAEHLFLLFNSISNQELGMGMPDPMPKICDVYGGGQTSYLLSAVGNSMEWDHIMPFYGGRQIVKGSIYSYYEFSSSQLLNDEEWRTKVKTEDFMPWVKPYITDQKATGMANTLYGQ